MNKLEQFEAQFAEMVANANETIGNISNRAFDQLERDELALEQEEKQLRAAVLNLGENSLLKTMIAEFELKQHDLRQHRRRLETQVDPLVWIPKSAGELKSLLEEEFARLATNSVSYALHMRQLVPDIHIYSIRSCDRKVLFPRARARLNLAGTIANVDLIPELSALMSRTLTLDLFEPSQRERIRGQAVRLAGEGLGPKAIAARIDEQPVPEAVSQSLRLHQKMMAEGLTEPYRFVLDCPTDMPKIRRAKHKHYSFQPFEGYQRPTL